MTTFSCPDMQRTINAIHGWRTQLDSIRTILEHDPNPMTVAKSLQSICDHMEQIERGDLMDRETERLS